VIYLHAGSIMRRVAQTMRHAPGLRSCDPVWEFLRAPYGRLLRAMSARHGLPLDIGGHTIRLDPRVANLNWETVEPEAYRAFDAAVKPSHVVFDVGAHFGTYALIALHNDARRIVAYEPCSITRAYLERHLKWNEADGRIVVRPVCCGASVGRASFYFTPGVPEGINGLVREEGMHETEVDVTTIDVETQALGVKPDIVKIDVEGAELDVLRGAERLLATGSPQLFLSLHPKRLASRNLAPADITGWLAARGYRCDTIAEDQEIHVVAQRA
jgi:FkbM family methyltransferase